MAAKDLEKFLDSPNIVDQLSEEKLKEISGKVLDELDEDKLSRAEWEMLVEKAMDLAKLKREVKSHPWPNAASIKYPIITNAAIQFASRTYPEIVRNGQVVQAKSIGFDPQGLKQDRARRISKHMSYQLLFETDKWEEDFDKLLNLYSIIGTVFKKTWFDPVEGKNVSELLLHDELIVNNNIRSLETARRVSHLITMHTNTILQNMRSGLFTELSLDELKSGEDMNLENGEHIVVEQHRYLDLDDDGYEEPYIVTVHQNSAKVLRVVPRYVSTDIVVNEKLEVVKITPTQFFTDFHFLPSPDGKFHSIGYGILMLHMNETVNTILNQLIDSGTLANLQGGFLGKGLRIKGGSMRLTPGEWKKMDSAAGVDIGRNIVPLAYKEPSTVLFQLLGLLINASKELSSNTEALQGTAESQNTPATTILALVEQGLKVYSAIQRRLHRSLAKEFKKLYKLNQLFLDPQAYLVVLDDPQAQGLIQVTEEGEVIILDYEDEDLDIRPVSDPNMSSEAQRLAKDQAMLSLTAMPEINRREVLRQHLETLQVPNMEQILPPPQPAPPDPEMIELQSQLDMRAKELEFKEQEVFINAAETNSKILKNKAEVIKTLAEAEGIEPGIQLDQYKAELDTMTALNKIELDRAKEEVRRDEETNVEGLEGVRGDSGIVSGTER